MTFVDPLVSGNIDLSIASNLALSAVVCGKLYESLHVPMPVAAVAAIVIGAALGLFNGLLITRLRLPSLTVTVLRPSAVSMVTGTFVARFEAGT